MNTKHSILLLLLICLLTAQVTACSIPYQVEAAGILKVHFLDVGQADCIFIQLPDGKTVLIDGGNKEDWTFINKYLQNQKIKTIDLLIATHPHEDHIGSLPNVIKGYQIGNIYMPKATANTKVFEDLLLAIKSKGYKINTAAAGIKAVDTKDVKLSFIAPNSTSYDELNNYSAVVKLTYKNNSFVFAGDAEDISEEEIMKKGIDLKADVLKVGHHGGRTSTTKRFLAKVSPKYAIISVGKDNDYGHPHKETITRLKEQKLETMRTDELGTIIAAADGEIISFEKKPSGAGTAAKVVSSYFIGNINTKKFHKPSCSSLPSPANQVKFTTKTKAQDGGYQPCQKCKP